jgi:uncharacterized protein (TIGR02444 family)
VYPEFCVAVDLWFFATKLYAHAGAASACLALQDGGADLCLLLGGVWLDRRGVTHCQTREARLRELAKPWQQTVVEPLRQLRRDWRSAAQQDTALDGLRERVKQLELDAERILLLRLQRLTADWPTGAENSQRIWLEALTVGLAQAQPEACETLYRASLELLSLVG